MMNLLSICFSGLSRISLAATVLPVGFAAGVLLGGILTDNLGWRWVMFVNLPISILTLVLTPLLLSGSQEQTTMQHIDLAGAFTVTTGLIALVYSLEQAAEFGWTSAQTLILLGIILVLLTAFVLIEARSQAPLVPLRVFRLRTLTGANIIFDGWISIGANPKYWLCHRECAGSAVCGLRSRLS